MFTSSVPLSPGLRAIPQAIPPHWDTALLLAAA